MITIDLSDKTILITGALGGIAIEGVVPRLLEAGARLILTDIRPPDQAADFVKRWEKFREQFEYCHLDINDAGKCDAAVGKVFQKYPGLNVALAHAGANFELHPFAETNHEQFDGILHFNLTGQTYFARSVLHQWTQRGTKGHLIFTSTWVSRIPWKNISAYCTAKAGLEMFARCLALEYSERGIRINCLAPGNVAAGASKLQYESDDDYRRTVDRVSPLGKRNSPLAIGDAFVFMCSPLADEMHGQVLQVDAGVGLPKLG
jgi:NAD(P)-dependent dehydrogenase (short-subunit alcohol dehydrogenase family)